MKSLFQVLSFAFFTIVLIFGCKPKNTNTDIDAEPIYEYTKSIVDDSAMVVTAHPIATQAGLEILKMGGNAIDAAIAVQFSLAVCYPIAGNIGGGGFMIYRDKNGEVSTLDYREMAPSGAHEDMYLDEKGNAISDLSRNGGLAVGVPGTVAGMYEAFLKYSELKDWSLLLSPSMETAKNGFKITHMQAENLNKNKDAFDKYNSATTRFNSKKWEGGDLLLQPELFATLMAIAEEGPKGFYEGKVADQIVHQMKKSNGIITHEDLKNYRALWRQPLISEYRDHKIISMPPPSSGGICLSQILGMVEDYDFNPSDFHSSDHIHLIAEAERRAYADRATHLADADFYDVPQKRLLEKSYLKQRMEDFNPDKATSSTDIKSGNVAQESPQTTHYSIVDSEGNAVSITTTLNGAYGSKLVVDEAGFFLNNEMDDFSAKPGVPNLYGLVGAEANKIEPGKRMLSSMTPTIIEKDGKLLMVVGTPGGSTIITSVLQTVMNVIDFKMNAKNATHAPRFHHQWLPDELSIEKNMFSEKVIEELKAKGHKIRERGLIGKVETILIKEDGMIEGAADFRANDDAKGF